MSQTTTLVNGDVAHSAFVDHLVSYPLVSNGIATYKSYPLGAQTIQLFNQGYSRFVSPFITHPFAQEQLKPRISPYLSRADSFGNESLTTIDAHFPVLQRDPKDLQVWVWSYLQTPFVVADEGKKHLLSIYNQELQKQGGEGYVAGAKAVLTTSLVTTSETLTAIAQWVGQKEGQVKAKVETKLDEFNEKFEK